MARSELRVGALTPLTSLDYPGELAAVVFCQGCPWRCVYCHNPDLQAPQGPEEIPWREVLGFLERRRGLLDAVVFSGGEPTLQTALAPAMVAVRALGFKVGLHTAGIYPGRLARLFPLLDWVGLDVKAPEEDYAALAGVPNGGAAAWDSARRLLASGLDHELRITVHPRLVSPAAVARLVVELRALGARRLVLQPCRVGQRSVTLAAYQALLEEHSDLLVLRG